ncbi:type II toxin-antitoxin system RelE/ParE family toxin [Desulfotomaculum copahuensis]|uniref:type II toxin-antitoxin system RelE/ParE family toxin n=1 Tax=Desulfotomaculum copahuensis TaxID=1838280 RepID=UPI000B18D389|nr:hypothetical protein [Desulfotomaculum copahuensis]
MRFVATEKFEKSLSRMSDINIYAVEKALRLLRDNPKHPSLRVKRVKGTADIWEASATKSIRITFRFLNQDIIQLRNVGTHEQVFKPPY